MALTKSVENNRQTARQETTTENGESYGQNPWRGTRGIRIINEIPHPALNHEDRKGGENSHAKPPSKSAHGLFRLYLSLRKPN